MKTSLKHILLQKSLILIFFAIIGLTSNILSVILPMINGRFIDQVSKSTSITIVYKYILFIAGIMIFSVIISFVLALVNLKLTENLKFSLYKVMIDRFQKADYFSTLRFSKSYLNQRLMTDCKIILEFILEYYAALLFQFIQLIVLLVLMYQLNVSIFWIHVLILPLYFLVYFMTKHKIYCYGLDTKEKYAEYYDMTNIQLEITETIKGNSLFKNNKKMINHYFNRYFSSFFSFTKWNQYYNAFDGVLTLLLTIAVIGIGGKNIIAKTLTIGTFVIISNYSIMMVNIIKVFFGFGSEYQDFKNSYDRLNEIYNLKQEETGTDCISKLQKISLKEVSFSYPNKKVLENVNLQLEYGNIYLLTGQNGVGKSTLIQCIIGLLKVDGIILYNNKHLLNYDLIKLREKHITCILQQNDMLPLTIEQYIRFISNYSIEEVIKFLNEKKQRTLKDIYFNESFSIFKNKDETLSNLSGGEYQKVVFLAYILRQTEVFILDEPCSQMDKDTTKKIMDYLIDVKNDHLIIMITHHKIEYLSDHAKNFVLEKVIVQKTD